jgi:3-hydroxybutyryl-CoA dehydrogenase
MNVVIAGELPFVSEIGELCLAAGHDVEIYLVEDFLSALHSEGQMAELEDSDVVIEAHHESAETKQELLLSLSRAVPPQALLLASALNVSAAQAAAWSQRPCRVVGYGVIPPLAAGDTVELAPALQTGDEALQQAVDFWRGLGLETAVVADGPGLVRARTVCCLVNEAASALMEGVASAADIDRAMELGTNYPRGPLAWGDLMGLDTVLGVMEGLFHEWGEDRYRPSPLLRRMVLAGKLGQKTGEGFYTYEKEI